MSELASSPLRKFKLVFLGEQSGASESYLGSETEADCFDEQSERLP